jgi:hypothetical protein
VFCSQACQDEKNSKLGAEHPLYIPGKSCLICTGPIPWRPGIANRENAKFCGNACKFAWQRQPENAPNYTGAKQPATCQAPGCGREFSYYPSVQPNASACSPACRSALHSIKMTGRRPSNGVYTSPATFRYMIRREFRDRCAICGWDEAPCDVAHIDGRKDGGAATLDNVTMLCPNHHRMFNLGLIPAEEIRATRVNVLKHQLSPL